VVENRFIVLGAYQALNAAECRHHLGLDDDTCELVLLTPPQPRSAAETRAMIDACGWAHVREIGPRNTSIAQWIRKVRNAKGLRQESAGLQRLVIGDYQMQLGLHAAQGLGQHGELIALDDGLATMRISEYRHARAAGAPLPRLQPQVRPLELAVQRRLARLLGLRLDDPASLTFFTVYDLEPAGDDRVERNTFAWLRSRFAPPEVVPGTLFLGSPLVESGITTPDIYTDLLRKLRACSSEPLWYRPHPRESPDRVGTLVRDLGVQLLELDSIVEYGVLESGWVPETVVANHSTTLDTLRIILGDVVTVRSVPVPVDLVPRRWKPFIEMAYADLDRRLGMPVERLELL
jgi:hypothetical protein